MHKGLLIVLFVVAGSLGAEAQSLKDMLYGGKLKMDSNTVLRKSDDYKARLDTAQKKAPEVAKPVATVTPVVGTTPVDSANKTTGAVSTASATTATETTVSPVVEAAPTTAALPAKSNTKLWKEYTDSLAIALKEEVLSAKKIKKETYYITVGYEIELDGKVTVYNVAATPANNLIEDQVKQRMEINPLQLAPMLDSNGKPRKVKRSYNFSVTKD